MGVDIFPHLCYNGIKIKRKELVNMNEKLYNLLAEHINKELSELDIHANTNDMNGIIENVLEDIDERIIQYYHSVSRSS